MKLTNNKKKKLIIAFFAAIVLLFSCFFVFLSSEPALAQDANSVVWGGQQGNIGSIIGLGDQDPRVIAAKIIRVFLGFLGIVALGLVVYGGWVWMTAGGDEQKLDKAKKILTNAVIGFIIILASFSITQLILNKLLEATGGGGSYCEGGTTQVCGCDGNGLRQCIDGTWGPCSATGCDSGVNSFYVKSTNPNNGDLNVIKNVRVRFMFNSTVRSSSAILDNTFKVTNRDTGLPISGALSFDDNKITFAPDAACPANICSATGCFADGVKVRVEVINGAAGVLSANGLELSCGGFGSSCSLEFDVGTKVDCEPPQVSLDFNQACVMANNLIYANSSDDSGVDYLNFTVEGVPLPTIDNPANDDLFNTRAELLPASWDGSSFQVGDPVNFKVEAFDVDSNKASDEKTLKMRPAHCCNLAFDPDLGEEQMDCGGPCAACDGAACGISLSLAPSCAVNPDANCDSNNCASGFCNCGTYAPGYCKEKGYADAVGDKCCICENSPIIDWVTPAGGFCSNDFNKSCQKDTDCGDGTCNLTTANGAEGNFVTIGGRYFDTYLAGTSKVEFSKDNGATWKNADLAGLTYPICGDIWSNNQVIVIVPKEVDIGPSPKDKILIKITNKGGFSDITNDDRGSNLDFVLNTIIRPGLCKLTPISGKMNTTLTYDGINFIVNTTEARFGNNSNFTQALGSIFTTNLLGTAKVPNINTGTTTSYVFHKINNIDITSNYLDFRKLEEAPIGPFITSFDPQIGATGQYVTILGGGFGNSRGTNEVWFGPIDTGEEADYKFPKVCADSYWRNEQVIVKVPTGLTDDTDYLISMKIGTTSKIFKIDTSKLTNKFFKYDKDEPLKPSLCKIDPILGPALSEVSLWGEYFDDVDIATSKVRFSLNASIAGFNNTNWRKVDDAYQVDTSVPNSAVSGPVKVVKYKPGPLPNESVGNGLNFEVGNCKIDSDCGALGLCCVPGSFKADQCALGNDPKDCFPPVSSSVFEWDFSTNASTKPTTCSGYKDAEQCNALGQCPNSPGTCQTETNVSAGDCGTDYCNNTFSQCAGNCLYDDAGDNLNKCKLNLPPPACEQKSVVDGLTAECRILPTGVSVWQVASTTCPTNSFKDINGWCTVGKVGPGNSKTCKTCPDQFSCSKNECVINNNICPANSTCDIATEKCKSSDICECCCEVAKSEATCCAGLTCKAGGCGSDLVNYGLCTGCKVELDAIASPRSNNEILASDNACNCSGGSTRYCEVGLICSNDSSDCPVGSVYGAACNAGAGTCQYDTGTCRDRKPCDDDTSNTTCEINNTMCDSNEYCDPTDCFCRPGTPCDNDATTPACEKDDTLCDVAEGFHCDEISGCVCKPKSCVLPDALDCSAPTECNADEFCDGDCICKPSGGGTVGMKCNLATPPWDQCGVPSCSNAQNLDCLADAPIPTTCPLCCCAPPAENNAGLKCTADKSPCTGAARGLFCGCTDDTQCGDTTQAGCSADTCCRARPKINEVNPADKATNICRNAVITAKFDQLMDIASFTGNIIVIGDYGTNTCPAGTQYILTKGDKPKGFFARAFTRATRALNQVIKPLIPSASALTNTYCAVSGAVNGYNNPDNTTNLTFSPSNLLDANKKYYVIVKGDKNYTDGKREGMLSAYGVTIDGAPGTWPDFNGNSTPGEDNDRTFNGVKFYGYVWSFNTRDDSVNKGICTIGKVEVVPSSYLFQKSEDDKNENDADKNASSFDKYKDNDKVFWAKAISADGQLLASTTAYGWDWSWSTSNPGVVNYNNPNPYTSVSDRQLFAAQQGITDGFSELTAEATVVPSGEKFSGKSNVWVFICDNPWPAINPISGLWNPWADNCLTCSDNNGNCLGLNTGAVCSDGSGTCKQLGGACFDMNYQLYYCRDNAKAGSADDLPAIISDKTIMVGSSTDKNILKEYYFFREAAPDVSGGVNLSLTNQTFESTNGKVALAWSSIEPGVIEGYKIYYGKKSGQYDTFITVKNKAPSPQGLPVLADINNPTYLISNLKVGQTYYFTVTAYYSTGAESSYSAEANIQLKDLVAPNTPASLNLAKACDGQATVFWNANTDDTVGYKVFYGSTQSGSYGASMDVKDATSVTLTGLNNGLKYYLVVKAYDASKNESVYSNEVAFTVIDSSKGSCFNSSDGLVLWHTFDSADISGTTAKDKSGNGNDGAIGGFTTVMGKIGQALNFSSNTLNFGSKPQFNIPQMSIIYWVKPTASGGNYFHWNNHGAGTDIGTWMRSDDTIRFQVEAGSADSNDSLISNNKLVLNKWNFVAVTYNGTKMSIYINGDPDNSKDHLTGGDIYWSGNTSPIWAFGSGGGSDSFVGAFDEARIYNRALNASDIKALYDQLSSASIQSSKIAEWKFEEGIGTTANDSIGDADGQFVAGQVSWANNGKVGKAVYFNETGGINYGSPSVVDFGFSDVSFSLWVKTENMAGGGPAIVSTDAMSGRIWIYYNKSINEIMINTYFGTDYPDFYCTNSVSKPTNDGQWHSVIATFEKNGFEKLYIDSVLTCQRDISAAASMPWNSGSLMLSSGFNGNYKGYVDEFAIYNKAFSANEVKDLYNSYK